ncbi:hypothetical protein GE118_01100 [Mycoplasma sp. NEAQ87857]|uniref:HinT-interacting membrane complex protein P80 n=1 Tax=Mycoplasma sp. NEAQ87857 TaxID=2683967 RepID=UPI001318286A|nr:hypothetical protein [Mycoplasma sp. NEAQ87857]QGZ97390.1 hypothetical protein GE118_01100 [Mycoplasma sp. NEAQ87857]
MAKNQKSFFERLSELNDKHEQKHAKQSTNRSKRKKLSIAILSALGVGVIGAIAIPLGIANNKINYVQPLDSSVSVIGFNDQNNSNNNNQISVGQLVSRLDNNDKEIKKDIDKLYRKLVFYWYQEEAQYSIQYQAKINATLKDNEPRITNIALPSLEDIKTKQRNAILDQKIKFQTQRPQGWQDSFNKYLANEKNGNSKTIDEAVEYLTFKEVEKQATRRFRIQIIDANKSWLKTASSDIETKNSLGNTGISGGKIVVKKGDLIFPDLKDGSVLDNWNDNNNVLYFANSSNDNIKILKTESYVPAYMSPISQISKYFDSNKLLINTIIPLPGKQEGEIVPNWTFDQDDKNYLQFLLSYTYNNDDKQENTVVPYLDKMKQLYLPASKYIVNDNLSQQTKEYNIFLKGSTNNKVSNLGTSGIQSLDSILINDASVGIGSIIDQLKGENNSTVQLASFSFANWLKLPTEWENKINAIKAKTDISRQIKVEQINNVIEDFIKQISNNKDLMNEYLQTSYLPNFNSTNNEQNTFSSFFKVSDMNDNGGGYIVFNNGKPQWIRTEFLNKERYINLLKSDLEAYANQKTQYLNVNKTLSMDFNEFQLIANVFKLNSNDELVDSDLLKDLLKDTKTDADKTKEKQEIVKLIKYSKSTQESLKAVNNIKILSNVSKYLKDQTKEQNNLNFSIANGEISIKLTSGNQNAKNVIKNALNELNVLNKGGK